MNNLNKFLGQKKRLVVSILIILLLCSAGGMLSIYLRYHSLAHLRQSKKTSVNRTLYDIVLGDNNPFRKYANMSPEDLKAIPKYDRPDLAALHDFIMTQDPSLGYPPVERKIQAFQSNWWIPPLFLDIIPGVQWLTRGPKGVGGRTRAIMFDPMDSDYRKVWAGGISGGLWYNNNIADPDSSWHPVDDFMANLAISSIAYDPTNTRIFYLSTGEGWFSSEARRRGGGIWKSTDSGKKWTRLDSTIRDDFRCIQKLVVHPSTGDVYAATREAGIQRSQDNGASWEKVLGKERRRSLY